VTGIRTDGDDSATLTQVHTPGWIVRLVKIDAEGHDLQVLLAGALESLLQRDWPRLIVEDSPGGTVAWRLTERGYAIRASAGNILGQPDDVVSGA